MKEFISEDDARRFEQLARIERGRQVLAQVAGQTRESRRDGYVNMLNKYGTSQDNSTAYNYTNDPMTPDLQLTQHYESGGLFAKIIDLPSEEAVKHGFDMNLNSPDIEEYIDDSLDWLEWEEKAATAIKWARLFGGSIIVMLVNDGRGIEEPLDWQNIKGIDELRVYERAIVQPDYTSLYSYDPRDPLRKTTSRFAMPEFYNVFSMYGTFKVHESRCLVFRNGILPERTTQAYYRYWGMPEYVRIQKELREAITSHSYGVKMLERSVQAIYSMKDLARLLQTEDGEEAVLKRLQVIDMARGILNSIAIDSEGEQYDFKNMQLSGVKDVIDTTCNMLSAVTNIPQTLLFGRSPAGENSTGESDLENYYNHVERIQKLMLRGNLKTLLDVIIRAGLANGKIEEEPAYKLKFVPLWSMSESEQATVEQTKATTAQTKAQTAQLYVDMGAVDPSEIRAGLAKDEEFNIEELLDDASEDELWGMGDQTVPQPGQGPEMEQAENASGEGSGASPVPPGASPGKTEQDGKANGAAVLVMRDGKVLIGKRRDGNGWCGPGGHVEDGESSEEAAARELTEEFGITARELIPIGTVTGLDEQFGEPVIFLCTDYDGEPACDGKEMEDARFVDVNDLDDLHLFPPFIASVNMLLEEVVKNE